MREVYPLNFNWFFKRFDPKDITTTTFDAFDVVHIPHNAVDIPFHDFDETDIYGVFSYVKHFEIKDTWKDKHIFIQFDGVAHEAIIYINGKKIKSHQGGYVPFTIDVTAFIDWKQKEQRLMVKVDTHENPSIPPFGGVVDYLGYGGIYREVDLIVLEKNHIQDVTILANDQSKVRLKIHLSTSKGNLGIAIYDFNQTIVNKIEHPITDDVMDIVVDVKDHLIWSLENPFLYKVEIKLYANDTLSDQVTETFGFRHAVFKNDGFYLNHKKIKLIGLNRHQSFPYVGNAMPKQAQIDDADLLKFELGINMVRTAHYPQSKHFIKRCDEIGLLVFEEIPGWQHIGDAAWKENSFNDLTQMIKRDKNHPSIVLWGVRINESPDDDLFYMKTNDIAHQLDGTRQTGGVRNIAKSHFFEDVYTYNDFSHQGNNRGLEPKHKICKRIPYLVTEFNGHMFPTKRFDDEAHRIDHAKRHLNVLNEMLDPKNGISGAIGWAMADYNTHASFGSGDLICYHGVLDMFRIPKLAAASYQSQQSTMPFMKVTSDMHIGEYAAGKLDQVMVLTNLDYIKLYQNDQYINTFYPNHRMYPNLIHPPIIIDDFIGNRLIDEEHMTKKDSNITKNLFKSVMNHGPHLPLIDKLKFLYVMKKNKLTYDQSVKLFFKYVSGWGSKTSTYRFEGYKNDQHVQTEIKGLQASYTYVLEMKSDQLVIGQTYDCAKITIKKVDAHQNVAAYAFDPVSIQTEGVIECIGPQNIHLSGGVAAFWIKTSDLKGNGKMIINIGETQLIKEVKVI